MVTKEYLDHHYQLAARSAFRHARPQEEPRIIVAAGQPGSYKSTLLRWLFARDFQLQGGAAVIENDVLRAHHPSFREILVKQLPLNATHSVAIPLRERLISNAIKSGFNLLTSTRLRNEGGTQFFEEARQAAAPYRIEIWVIARNRLKSYQTACERREKQIESCHMARRVATPAQHQAVCLAIPEELARIESRGRADRIVVVDDQFYELYDSTTALTPGGARTAYEAECDRSWTPEARLAHIVSWQNILVRMRQRNASEEDITAVECKARADAFRLFSYPERDQACTYFPELAEVYRILGSGKREEPANVARSSSGSLDHLGEQLARQVEAGELATIVERGASRRRRI